MDVRASARASEGGKVVVLISAQANTSLDVGYAFTVKPQINVEVDGKSYNQTLSISHYGPEKNQVYFNSTAILIPQPIINNITINVTGSLIYWVSPGQPISGTMKGSFHIKY